MNSLIKTFLFGFSTGFALLIFSLSAAFSQENLSFRQLSVNDGLSQNSAVSVTQDQDGFLWIATQEGLNRYDGRDFRIYDKKFLDITESSRLLLGKVFADSKNRIWIIPDSSIPELLDRENDSFIPIDGITSVTSMAEDIHGKIWFGTLSGQLFSWNEEIKKAEMTWSDPSKEIVNLSILDEQNLLLTLSDEVISWNLQSGVSSTIWKPEAETILAVSILDPSGRFWFGTLNHGLWTSENLG